MILFENSTLFFQAIGRSSTAIRELSQLFQLILIFLLMNIHIHIGLFCNLQSIFNFKTMTTCYGQSRYQLVQIGRTVRRTHFHSLFLCSIIVAGSFQRISQHTHICLCRPSKRNTYQYGTVAITPANICRSFLMRHQTEIRSRIRITESCNGRCKLHHSRNSLTGSFRKYTIFQHLVLTVFHNTHMDMQS